MIAVTKLARMAGSRPMGTTTTYHQMSMRVGAVTAKAVGFDLDEGVERVQDRRDGTYFERRRLRFVPRKAVKLIHGELAAGKLVRVEIPDWALKYAGIPLPERETA